MSDRLQELLRQRALMQEHLAWLEGEIGALAGDLPPALPARSWDAGKHVPPLPVPPAPAAAAGAIEHDAASILSQFEQDPSSVKQDTRRGCLLAFAIAMALLILAAAATYAAYAHHLGRWW